MQKWEYLYIQAFRDQLRYINGAPIQRGANNSLPEYLNKAGEEGWELVGVCRTDGEGPTDWKLVFKRPKG